DPIINAHTDKVITIASPFHGSPLANEAWMTKELNQDPFYCPMRLTNKLSYWIARRMYPTFEQDFHWDNFDRAIAAQENAVAAEDGEAAKTAWINPYLNEKLDHLVTYGSYFGVDESSSTMLLKALNVHQSLPKEKSVFHSLFSYHIFVCLVQAH